MVLLLFLKEPFTENDLTKIEKRMAEIIDEDVKTKEVWTRENAIKHFKKIGEKYKAEIIENIPNESFQFVITEKLMIVQRAHIVFGKNRKAFKLTKVSGAYWRVTLIMKCYKEFTVPAGKIGS